MPKDSPYAFKCQHCGAQYQVVRVEVDSDPAGDDSVTCPVCGAPLAGRDGQFILKYFLVERPRRRNPRPPTSVIASAR